jgi:UDP-N-acetylglucosamine:LPS N-acetylglucosamine transferase
VLWIGSVDGMEQALVERVGIAYQGISTGQIRGINPLKALSNAGRMAKGVQESLSVLRSFAPDVCLVTGGYVCAPMALACRMRGVPVMIYLPDMAPGASIRSLSRLADRVAVSFPEVAPFFGGEAPEGKAVVTGYPVRQELIDAAKDRAASRQNLAEAIGQDLGGEDGQQYKSEREPKLVLVWGGSQGSRNINQSVWDALPALLPHAHILHVVGVRDWPLHEKYAAENPILAYAERYHPVSYLHEAMPLALAAADITVARAGASSLGEFPVAHLPSILVPLPYAGVNQRSNADLLAGHGAAVVIEDEELSEELTPRLLALLEDDTKLAQMADAATALARPDAALKIAQTLVEISSGNDETTNATEDGTRAQ